MTVICIGIKEVPEHRHRGQTCPASGKDAVHFVVDDAAQHGIEFLDEPWMECNGCGARLTPDDLDKADETKSTSSSWRERGQPKCIECGKVPLSTRAVTFRLQHDPPFSPPYPSEKAGPVTDGLRKWIFEVWGETCVAPDCSNDGVHCHHIVPRYMGGVTTTKNVAPLCRAHHGKINVHADQPHPTFIDDKRQDWNPSEFSSSREPHWVTKRIRD